MEIDIAGLVVHVLADRIELSRRGRPEVPRAVVRFGEGSEDLDVYLRLSNGDAPSIERRVASVPMARIQDWSADFQQRLADGFIRDLEWTTPEALAEAGYVVMAPGAEHSRRWLEHVAPEEEAGRRLVRSNPIDDPKALEMWFDTAIEPTDLRSICVPGERRDLMWAVHSELNGPDRMLLWLETPEGWQWATVRLDTWGERIQQVMRAKVPAAVVPVMEAVARHLKLEDLGLVRDEGAVLPLVPAGPFDLIATRHAARAYDIEHFASVGAFAASTVERALPEAGGAFAELERFQSEIARHAICRLLESAEIAIGEARAALIAALWDVRWREAYDAVSRSRGESGEERLREMMKAIAGRIDGIAEFAHLNKLRHGWTHRSSIADPRLFADLGRNGKEMEALAWSGVALELRLGEEVVVDQRHVTATCRLVTRLVDGLAGVVAARLGSRAETPDSDPPA
jgi:hypothetical protein